MTADYHGLIARTPEEFRQKNRVSALTGHRVTAIDPGAGKVDVTDLATGRGFSDSYTRLLLSTGAYPFAPPIPGVEANGCFTLRTLEDGLRIKSFVKETEPRRAVIVGAGPIGMEMSESFKILGMEVTLVELAGQVMPLMDPDLATIIQERLEREGVRCLVGTVVEAFEERPGGGIRAASTPDGSVECDVAVLAIGVKPSSELAERAGVELGARGAIRVDRTLATSIPGVFAAGDCATSTNVITGDETWIPLGSTSRKQGRLAADNMFGASQEFPGVLGTSVVKCFDLTIGRTGLDEEEARRAGFDPVTISMQAESLHPYYPDGGTMNIRLTGDRAGGRLLGAQVVGEGPSAAERRLDVFASAITGGLGIADVQYLDLAYAPPYSTAVDAAIIAGNLLYSEAHGRQCSCDAQGLE